MRRPPGLPPLQSRARRAAPSAYTHACASPCNVGKTRSLWFRRAEVLRTPCPFLTPGENFVGAPERERTTCPRHPASAPGCLGQRRGRHRGVLAETPRPQDIVDHFGCVISRSCGEIQRGHAARCRELRGVALCCRELLSRAHKCCKALRALAEHCRELPEVAQGCREMHRGLRLRGGQGDRPAAPSRITSRGQTASGATSATTSGRTLNQDTSKAKGAVAPNHSAKTAPTLRSGVHCTAPFASRDFFHCRAPHKLAGNRRGSNNSVKA